MSLKHESLEKTLSGIETSLQDDPYLILVKTECSLFIFSENTVQNMSAWEKHW